MATILELSLLCNILLYNICWDAVGEEADVDASFCNRITKNSTFIYYKWKLNKPHEIEKEKTKWREKKYKNFKVDILMIK